MAHYKGQNMNYMLFILFIWAFKQLTEHRSFLAQFSEATQRINSLGYNFMAMFPFLLSIVTIYRDARSSISGVSIVSVNNIISLIDILF